MRNFSLHNEIYSDENEFDQQSILEIRGEIFFVVFKLFAFDHLYDRRLPKIHLLIAKFYFIYMLFLTEREK